MSDLVVVCKAQSEPAAFIIKSRLESEGIPAHIRMETIGSLYGLTATGLGQVSVLVPGEFAEEAKSILETREFAEEDRYISEPKDIEPKENNGHNVKLMSAALLIFMLLIFVISRAF